MKQTCILIIMILLFSSCQESRNSQNIISQIRIDTYQLDNKDINELRLMRNEIFARYGYRFKSQDLKDYFSKMEWYNPRYDNVDSLLTDIDKLNIQTILNKENELKAKSLNKNFQTNNYVNDSIFVIKGDSVKLPPFEIELNLTEKTISTLEADKESIIVQAYFRGEPIDTTIQEYKDFDHFTIGDYRIELVDTNVARFDNVYVDKKLFDMLSDKNFEILINVFTGRRSSQYNLINCDILQEPIFDVMNKRHILKGKLL